MGQITIKYPDIDNPRFQDVMQKEGITAEALTTRMKKALHDIFVLPGRYSGGCYFHGDAWYAMDGGYPGGPADCVSYLFRIGNNVDTDNGNYIFDKFTGSSEAECLFIILKNWEELSATIEGEEKYSKKIGELKYLGNHPDGGNSIMQGQLQPSIEHIKTMIWLKNINITEIHTYIEKHIKMIWILINFIPHLWSNKERDDLWQELYNSAENLSVATDVDDIKNLLKEHQATAKRFLTILYKLELPKSLKALSLLREDCQNSASKSESMKEVEGYMIQHQKLVRYLVGILNDTRKKNAWYSMEVWQDFKDSTTKLRKLRQKASYVISTNRTDNIFYKEFDTYMIEYKEIIDKFLSTLNQTKEDPTTPDMSAES